MVSLSEIVFSFNLLKNPFLLSLLITEEQGRDP